jgi:hypothetical protein
MASFFRSDAQIESRIQNLARRKALTPATAARTFGPLAYQVFPWAEQNVQIALGTPQGYYGVSNVSLLGIDSSHLLCA